MRCPRSFIRRSDLVVTFLSRFSGLASRPLRSRVIRSTSCGSSFRPSSLFFFFSALLRVLRVSAVVFLQKPEGREPRRRGEGRGGLRRKMNRKKGRRAERRHPRLFGHSAAPPWATRGPFE